MENNEKLAIVGSGIMGHSIALTAAWSGLKVKVWGTSWEDIEKAQEGLETKINVLIDYDIVTNQEKKSIMNSILFTESLDECIAEATFIIEAIPENLKLKQDYFRQLDKKCAKDTVIASNTSGLSATEISKFAMNPERTLVTHFWNPAHLMPLVEVVQGEQTSSETVKRAMDLLKSMNKKPILVKKDVLGSVGNRLQYAVFREAQFILQEGIASMEDIDAAVQYSVGRRFGVTGPFMTMDMGGLNTNAAITSYLFKDLSDAKEIFSEMKQLVDNGHIGPKSGKGFYDWSSEFTEKMEKEREEELIKWLKKDISLVK